jgi:CRISPR/Cas system-associated exonuclease Cas4 (RecB family)
VVFSIVRDRSFNDRLIHNLKKRYLDKKRSVTSPIHVSDLIGSCTRKQAYTRIAQEEDLDDISVHNFVRGELAEKIILDLADIDARQISVSMDGITGHIDGVMDGDKGPVAIELKDSASFIRLGPNDDLFRQYLKQLLAYMCMSDYIENGILSIRYNVRPMEWLKRDSDKNDFFRRKYDADSVGTESWAVYLSKDDILRNQLRQELLEKRDRFLASINSNDVSLLPRLRGRDKIIKCKSCSYHNTCWNIDAESDEAIKFGMQISPLDKMLIDVIGDSN